MEIFHSSLSVSKIMSPVIILSCHRPSCKRTSVVLRGSKSESGLPRLVVRGSFSFCLNLALRQNSL